MLLRETHDQRDIERTKFTARVWIERKGGE